MFKKISLIILVLVLVLGLVACKKGTNNENVNNQSIPDTGKVIDITNKNYQVIFAAPGDAILVTLRANQAAGRQWSFREPISGGYLSLKRHDVITENDSRLKPGEIISEWKFKIEKAGQFNLRLDYEQALPSEKPSEIFLIKIISDKKKSELPNILVDLPMSQAPLKSPLKLSGFARLPEGTVNYRLKDESGKVLSEGFVTAKAAPPEFGYFEQEIKFTVPASGSGVLEVFHPSGDPPQGDKISAKDGQELDQVTVPLTGASDE